MIVQIKELKDRFDSNICHIANDIYKALNLTTEVPYKINLGQSYEYSYITPYEGLNGCMCLSNSVFKKLLLFKDVTLNIWRDEGEIYLGPVVGIFVKQKVIERIKIGNPSLAIQKHGEAANKTNCLAFCYSLEGIMWDEGRIKGYTYDLTFNRWRYDWFPMPDILYDLGVSFNDHLKPYAKYLNFFHELTSPWIITYKKPNVEYMLQQFRAKNVQFINNQRYLGKWKVHESLSKYSDARIYLPKTIIYKGFDDVLSMLNEFDFVFVKASGGTQGKQVLSIELIDKKYKLTFNKHGLKEIIFNEINDVKRFVENFTKGREFIVQQGIRLIKYYGRNMDLRMLMMKDGRGEWQAVQHHCRIAKKTYTITNYSLGGDWIDYEEVYPCLCSQYQGINIPDNEELINTTRKVIYYYEKEFGSFGEIGMDMAVDTCGKIWLIEANTKPDKIPYDAKGIPDEAVSIFEYAKFLVNNNDHSLKWQ